MNLLHFFSAFGLGAIVTALVQFWLASKAELSKRSFQEKKESYIGYLDALYLSETEKTKEAALKVGHWKNRIELVGSRAVISCCERMLETNPTHSHVHPERPKVLCELKEAMRKDLSIDF